MQNEDWRPIAWLPGYSVSSLGRVRSEDRTVVQPCYPNGRTYKGRILRTYTNENGYEIASLPSPDGEKHKLRVHRLVALAFLGESPHAGMDVNHKNGVRNDNRLENLEWATRSENLLHGYRVNRRPRRFARGSQVGTSVLTESVVLEIRAAKASGESPRSIAHRYGAHVDTIYLVLRRKTWRHV